MSIWIYLYTGLALLLASLVLIIILARKAVPRRKAAEQMPMRMPEYKAWYRKRRWAIFALQMLAIAIMLLGTYIGK